MEYYGKKYALWLPGFAYKNNINLEKKRTNPPAIGLQKESNFTILQFWN